MTFSSTNPSPALQPFVRDYLIAHFVFDNNKPVPIKPYAPKPEQGLTFFARGGATMVCPQNGKKEAPPVSVFGQQLTRCNIHLTAEFLMFRVHFRPGVLFRLLKTPVTEFCGAYFDAELVLGRKVLEVSEQLADARGYNEMVEVVESFLMAMVKKANHHVHPVDSVAECLTADPSRFSLDWLASQACLSPRQFNRKFTERMGVGPKLYSRLVRFYCAYLFKEAYPDVDWFTIAIRFDYADYQHLVKDFKQFTNATPNLWLQEEGASPENLLRLYGK
jgi:AraC-like DNA-binding protein